MEFPRLVYKAPGPNSMQGGTYASMLVTDHEELKDSFRKGWFATLPEAVEGKHVIDDETELDDDAPPSREEMEEKARELGIKFDGRTGDKTLLKRINEALGG